MSRIGLGQARHILDALTTAGVDRDLIWEHEDGSVGIHDEARENVDIRVSHTSRRGNGYGATDLITDDVIATGGPLTIVAKQVAAVVNGPAA